MFFAFEDVMAEFLADYCAYVEVVSFSKTDKNCSIRLISEIFNTLIPNRKLKLIPRCFNALIVTNI